MLHRPLALALVAIALPCTLLASKPSLRLERIDPSPFSSEGKIRVFASLVELEGQVDDGKAAHAFSLRVDKKGPLRPDTVAPFRAAAVPLDLVLVIESSALYGVQKLPPPEAVPQPRPGKRKKQPAPAAVPVPMSQSELPLDHVKDALASFLEGRPAQTRVLVIDYGGDVTPHPPFRPAPSATGAIDELSPDEESGDLHLADAVRAALVELNRPRPRPDEVPPRRLIVVVSDGLNAQMDRKTFRALGDAAASAGVPIHSIAFSPADERGPLLNLGEISKRSNGTFRWARSADDLKAQIETLADELDKQYVLSFTPEVDRLEGHSFVLECDGLRSNALRYEVGGSVFGYTGSLERRSRVWTALGWIAGVLVGLFLLYLGFGIALRLALQPRGGAPTGASLLFLDGARRGERVALGTEVTLGKAGTVVVEDAAASSRHCSIGFDGRGWLVTDLGSTNGTWLEGRRLDQPTYLQPGQTLTLGQTRIRFLV